LGGAGTGGLGSMLVLAGRRAGERDALLDAAGVASKAFVPVAGSPMLARVIAALAASGSRAPIHVSGLDRAGLARLDLPPGADPDTAPDAPAGGPAGSVLAAVEEGGLALPVLVVTCDHALLRPDMVDHFVSEALRRDADLAVGLAEERVIQAAYPETRRTYLRLGGVGYSGCNLFLVTRPAGLNAIRFWQRAERDRKRPWRIARRFGPLALLWLVLRRPGVEAAFAFLSRRIGVRVAPVLLPFAEAAIDVDKPADLALVERILARRELRH